MVGVACGDRLSSTIACFCSSVHRRRRSTPVITSIRRGRVPIGAVVGPLRSGEGPASAGVDSVSIVMDVGDHRPETKGYVGSGRRLPYDCRAPTIRPRRPCQRQTTPTNVPKPRPHFLTLIVALLILIVVLHRPTRRTAPFPGLHQYHREHERHGPACLPQREALARRRDGPALDGSRHAGGHERVPTPQGPSPTALLEERLGRSWRQAPRQTRS